MALVSHLRRIAQKDGFRPNGTVSVRHPTDRVGDADRLHAAAESPRVAVQTVLERREAAVVSAVHLGRSGLHSETCRQQTSSLCAGVHSSVGSLPPDLTLDIPTRPNNYQTER